MTTKRDNGPTGAASKAGQRPPGGLAVPAGEAGLSGREGISVGAVGNDAATTCGLCGASFGAVGRQVWCSDACRQAAWRRRRAAPRAALPARSDTVYECPSCETRLLGVQRCEECNVFARRLGPGGPCPSCGDLVVVADLVSDDAFLPAPTRGRRS
jgi:hypothetical protein